MYIIHGAIRSRTLRVLWLLEELGIAYEHHPSPPRSDAVRALNPSGKVPVLIDGDAVLTDSTAILTWLADRHGALTFPAGSLDRARQDAFTFRVLDEFDATLWMATKQTYVWPEEHRRPEILDSLHWDFARSAARLAETLDGPHLMGDAVTVPDFILTHCLSWAKNAGFPPLGDRLTEYLGRMQARPAYARATGAAARSGAGTPA